MEWSVAINALGGLALFLLAMLLMTDGLTVFAGSGLKRLLGRWTSTPWRGVLAGIMVTGVVQSSSAVTVAAIGFVNAGVLTLRQALGVIFGTNVGTTMTGWLVSLVGFGFKIETFALPILTLGVILRLGMSTKRLRGLGLALAGFGLFFLGLAILKDAFGGLAAAYGAKVAAGQVGGGVLMYLLVGFVATVLTQSSSAAIAIILTAAAGGMMGMEAAASAVIGANLGTTSTAMIAVLKATSNAKRLALGHIAFNLLTGLVALLLLPALLWLVAWFGDALDIEGSPAAILALFHTVFNVLGVALMLPLIHRLERLLEQLFSSAEEDESRPRHLDATLAATPDLAVAALRQEIVRLRDMVGGNMLTAMSRNALATSLEGASTSAYHLSEAITAFVAKVRTENMPRAVADELATELFITRYLHEAARLTPAVRRLRRQVGMLPEGDLRTALDEVLAEASACAALAVGGLNGADADPARSQGLDRFQLAYRKGKVSLLDAAVIAELSVQTTDEMLDALSATRRAVEQLVKGDRLLRSPGQSVVIDVDRAETNGLPENASSANSVQPSGITGPA